LVRRLQLAWRLVGHERLALKLARLAQLVWAQLELGLAFAQPQGQQLAL
jgi:hypothetical protein